MWWRYVVTNVYCAFRVTCTVMWLMRVGYTICVPLTFTCLFVWIFGLVHMVATKWFVIDASPWWWAFCMTYGIMEILFVLFPRIPLHPNWITNIVQSFLIYDQHIATFISSGYGDLHTMMVSMVAYYHLIWILHYSLLVARYQNNITLFLLCA